jgi:dATP pyrophosphohydrolase
MYKQPISALIIIYTTDLQVLLLKRADFPEAWQSVTGSVEGQESVYDAAVREVREETAIDLSQPWLEGWSFSDWEITNEYAIYEQWRYRYAPGTLYNTEHVFGLKLPHPVSIRLSQSEHVDYKWIDWQAAAEMVFSPSNAEAIRLLPDKARH